MSLLYLYALAAEDPGAQPGAPLGIGLAAEPLRAIACGPGLFALAGKMPSRPGLARAALAAHDETVRRLAALVPALLPARFGETAPDEQALCSRLAPRAGELNAALALVRGSVQMTLRVFAGNGEGAGEPRPLATEGPPLTGLSTPGPGTHYLAERRRLHEQRRSLPEVAGLREALRPLLRAERVERHEAGRLLATAYDLVGRDAVEAYRSTVERESIHLSGYRVAASGPWPPYAFAPEVAS